MKEWRTPESRQAVVVNLEWPEMSDEVAVGSDESAAISLREPADRNHAALKLRGP